MNNYKDHKAIPSPYSFRYFDRRVPEEDTPINVSDEVNQRYEELDLIFEECFSENSLHLAKQQSKEEREKKGYNDSSYVYGEITFRSLSYIFEYVKINFAEKGINKGNFIDLGSVREKIDFNLILGNRTWNCSRFFNSSLR